MAARLRRTDGRLRPPADGTVIADLVWLPSQIWVILGLFACGQDLCS